MAPKMREDMQRLGLTQRELELGCYAWLAAKDQTIDWHKFARLAGYGSAASASVSFGKIKKKLLSIVDENASGPSTPRTPASGSRKTPAKQTPSLSQMEHEPNGVMDDFEDDEKKPLPLLVGVKEEGKKLAVDNGEADRDQLSPSIGALKRRQQTADNDELQITRVVHKTRRAPAKGVKRETAGDDDDDLEGENPNLSSILSGLV